MGKYIGKRLLQAVIILLGVSVIVFALVNFIPGDPYSGMYSPDIPTEEIEAKLDELGANDPIPIQYVKWLGRALTGDLGYSIWYKEPVISVILGRLGNTALLACSSILVSTLLGITVGIYSARHRKGLVDNVSTVMAFTALSIPSFFFGMILIKIFGVDLQILPISGMVTVGKESITGAARALDIARHMVLPTVVLGLMNAATMLRYTRSSMVDIQGMDFIRTARAKGLPERKVIYKHALKNALSQIITVLSLQIPGLLSGSLLTETVFLWPGVGRLNFEAVNHRDYPLIMGIVLILASFTLIANLIADISYAAIDPRVLQNDGKG
jgi:ABC-type dipeptide/oligopeptide/nickel transport systems, permease components